MEVFQASLGYRISVWPAVFHFSLDFSDILPPIII